MKMTLISHIVKEIAHTNSSPLQLFVSFKPTHKHVVGVKKPFTKCTPKNNYSRSPIITLMSLKSSKFQNIHKNQSLMPSTKHWFNK